MIDIKSFGVLKNGEKANLYILKNNNEMQVSLTDLGASITSIILKDFKNNFVDVVLGFDNVTAYEVNEPVFGSIVGRNANRIENATFQLEGKTYNLDKNDNNNNLHSGNEKLYTKLWNVKSIDDEKNSVTFSTVLEDGYQGFDGNFNIDVKYSLTDENELFIEYTGTSDKTTLANFTNHCYFNLNGHNFNKSLQDVLNHNVKIYAKNYTPFKTSVSIPSGKIDSVLETPFDFTNFKEIGKDINSDNEQIKIGNGYDHNFCLDKSKGSFSKVAEVFSPETKIAMEVYTDLPGLQFYTANFLDGSLTGKYNTYYNKRDGFCFETQYFPNAINIDNFQKPILKKGETYFTKTSYKFLTL